jgi:Xaa-Pro aminopeptidase
MNPRLQKLRKLISEEKLDGVLISSLTNITYVSDFSGFTTEDRDAYLLITKKKQYIFTHPIYKEVAEKDFKDFILVEMKRSNPFSQAVKHIVEKENINKLGFEAFDLTVNDFEKLTKETNKKTFVPVDLLSKLRIIKDSKEIQKIKAACELGDKTFTFIYKKLKTGITEKELAVEIEYFIKRNGADISFDPIVAFGPNASQPHHIPDHTKLKKNNFVLFDFGTKLNNYCSDMTRTVFFGKATKEQSELYHAVLHAQQASVDYLKIELKNKRIVQASTIDQVGRDYLTSLGVSPFNHSSHGIGLNVHESPRLYPSSNDTMTNGMVFSIEPGTYEPGKYGIRIEDIFAIENEKLLQLTKAPSNFIEIKSTS